MCVESCPSEVRSFWLEAITIEETGGIISEDKLKDDMEPFCDPKSFSKDKTPKELMKNKICPYWTLPANPYLGRW